MFVLHEVLGLSEDKMIVPVDEKRGRLLLAEILDGVLESMLWQK